MYTYHLSLGSNLGDRGENLQKAVDRLSAIQGAARPRLSGVYETEPEGLSQQPRFLNAVAELSVPLAPLEMLRAALAIEQSLGRVRTVRYGPRTLDIDILLCGMLVVRSVPDLVIPHPRLHERAFVLVPLAELAGDCLHPLLGRTIAQLCDAVQGKEGVRWHPTRLQNGFGPTAN